MSLRFWNKRVEFPLSACWDDPPDVVAEVTRGASKGARLPHAAKGRKRPPGTVPRGIVIHATSGTARTLRPGLIESTRDWLEARFMATTSRSVSWHATIDLDGSVLQHAGPDWTTWHASQVNSWADGFELVEGPGGILTDVQLAAFVMLVDVWTRETGAGRCIPWRDGTPYAGMITRCLPDRGAGRDVSGVYGHRSVFKAPGVPYRGHGDPGDAPFEALAMAGYKKIDIERGEDMEMWKHLQAETGLATDGVPGPKTLLGLLEKKGLPYGMLVERPGDRDGETPAWLAARRGL